MGRPTITNNTDIPLMLAVWLVHDEYDYINHPNYISVTGLMKPLRQIILSQRIPAEEQPQEDVEDYVSRGLGHSVHDSVEKAWVKGYRTNLKKLGYPPEVIDRVMINPTDSQLDEATKSGKDPIPLYLEQRIFREFNGKILGGKYDGVADGIVNDTKSTSAYSWVYGGRDADYQLQGSIYRWIDQKAHEDIHDPANSSIRPRINGDYIQVNFVFTDWQKTLAKSNKGYPQSRVRHKDIQLLTLEDTEAWIKNKLALIEKNQNVPESQLPECTDEELWMSDPVYKYYLDPLKAQKPGARATKNFTDLIEAQKYRVNEKGGKGVVKTIPGEPKRCAYCPVYDQCTQKDKYF